MAEEMNMKAEVVKGEEGPATPDPVHGDTHPIPKAKTEDQGFLLTDGELCT